MNEKLLPSLLHPQPPKGITANDFTSTYLTSLLNTYANIFTYNLLGEKKGYMTQLISYKSLIMIAHRPTFLKIRSMEL